MSAPELPASWGKLRRFLHLLTVQQWRAMEGEAQRDKPPTDREKWAILGLYLVACLIMYSNNFFTRRSGFEFFFGDLRQEPDYRLYRRLYWAWMIIAAYTIPTVIYARKVLGMGLRDLGLSFEGLRGHAWIYFVGFGIVFPFVVAVSFTDHFQSTYPFYRQRHYELGKLLLWELSYGVQFVALELFFRGFLIQGPRKVLGPWVVPIMVIPYMMIHFRKPPLEAFGAIIAGSTLGIVSYRSRSIYAGMAIHISVAWSMDLLSLWQQGKLAGVLGG